MDSSLETMAFLTASNLAPRAMVTDRTAGVVNGTAATSKTSTYSANPKRASFVRRPCMAAS